MRFTDKNGDHAEAGKIWENQIENGPPQTKMHSNGWEHMPRIQ